MITTPLKKFVSFFLMPGMVALGTFITLATGIPTLISLFSDTLQTEEVKAVPNICQYSINSARMTAMDAGLNYYKSILTRNAINQMKNLELDMDRVKRIQAVRKKYRNFLALFEEKVVEYAKTINGLRQCPPKLVNTDLQDNLQQTSKNIVRRKFLQMIEQHLASGNQISWKKDIMALARKREYWMMPHNDD